MNAYYVEFEPGRPRAAAAPQPSGRRVPLCRVGRLAVTVGEEEHELAGDSMYFDPSVPHAYRRLGARRVQRRGGDNGTVGLAVPATELAGLMAEAPILEGIQHPRQGGDQ
jgi:hypothetical protein